MAPAVRLRIAAIQLNGHVESFYIMETRGRIMRSAYDLFQHLGYGRVTMGGIAETAGVTKRTLYHYFRSKDDLLNEIVGMQSELLMARVHRWSTSAAADTATFIRELFREIAGPSTVTTWAGSGFTRIALELSHLRGHPARVTARRHKVEMETWLTDELRARHLGDPAALACDLMLLLEGAVLLVITHNDPRYAERAAGTATLLVESRRCSPQGRHPIPSSAGAARPEPTGLKGQ